MMEETVASPPPGPGTGTPPAAAEVTIHEMLEAAQRFLACRERAQLHAHWAEPPPVRTLAEAIERDFAGFDLERAEAEFRAALAALSQGWVRAQPDGTAAVQVVDATGPGTLRGPVTPI